MDAVKELTKILPEVKAVICDFELNLNWAKMVQAVVHLKREDILFLTGSLDKTFPLAAAVSVIGNIQNNINKMKIFFFYL